MAQLNTKRIWIGALVGGVAWNIWSFFINSIVMAKAYASAQAANELLKSPRYGYFIPVWIITLFILSLLAAWLYALLRDVLSPGPATALKLGLILGFFAAFPMNFSIATWSPLDRYFPMMWLIDLWVGAILATYLAGWLYHPLEGD